MELGSDLLKSFAAITNDAKQAAEKREQFAYGEVTVDGDHTYVKLDGAESLTPISTTTEIQNGDRVMVMIKNHTATVVGNLSHPALTKVGDVYMKMTNRGLVVGNLDVNGDPSGMYILIKPGEYDIMNANNTVAASFSSSAISFGDLASFTAQAITLGGGAGYFSASEVRLGKGDNAKIKLCNSKGQIEMDGDQLVIRGATATGIRSRRSDGYRAELVARAGWDSFAMAMQSFNPSNGVYVSHVLDGNGARYRLQPNTRVSVTTDGVNYANLLQSNDQMFYIGTKQIKKNIGGETTYEYSGTVAVPAGYVLAGILQVSSSKNRMMLIEFKCNPANNTVGATVRNRMSRAAKSTLTIRWFAIRSSFYGQGGADVVDLDPTVAE